MSQWILVALCLLAHPLMMLSIRKGMHGGSGNSTQQNSNNTEKPRKKVN